MSTSDGEAVAAEKKFIFQEVSAKNGTNINSLFFKDIFTQIKEKYNLVEGEGMAGNEDQQPKVEEIKLDTPRNSGKKKGCCK